MTISSTVTTITYAGDAFTTAFPIPFYFLDNSHLAVTKVTGVVVVSLILGTDYTLTGAGNLAGGTLTTTVPVAIGTNLVITRVVPIIQQDDYVSHNTFPAETMEKDLDYLTMISQQLSTSIAAIAGGATLTFQNIGASGASSYAGTSGSVVQLKKIAGAGSTTVTETSSQITVSSSASGIDTTLDYGWTGHHTWNKLSARTVPSHTMKSLQGAVDITDTGILLANNYSTMLDMRKRTDVTVEAPIGASWGGVFNIYGQHAISGNAGSDGWAGGGIRMQVETSAVRTFGSPGAISGYFGINNLGTDQGAFGVHTDAYHSGTSAGFSHSTYGFSAEVFKNITGGIALGAVLRSMGSQKLDYGLSILHKTGGAGFKRGIQFGSPLIANGGLPGGTGTLTAFDVGIDMTWGAYANNLALLVNSNDYICLSGQSLAQSSAQFNVCGIRFNSGTGQFQVNSFGTEFFAVNMTNGTIRQNGIDVISFADTSKSWAFSLFTTGGKNSSTVGAAGGASALPATPLGYIKVLIDGTTCKIPYFNQ